MKRLLAILLALILVAGCFSDHPKRVYILTEPVDFPADPGTEVSGQPVLELRRVLIPDYLDTTDIRMRVGEHELRSSPTGRWGERLSLAITRALRRDLAARLPMDRVILGTAERPGARQISVTVEIFEVWPDGHCMLEATWAIFDGSHRAVLTTGRDQISAPAPSGNTTGDERIVVGMADALSKLADGIASTAKGLSRSPRTERLPSGNTPG